MGFLQAVYTLGEMASKRNQSSPLADIINFLQLPYPVEEATAENAKNRSVHAIRVWLEADNPYSEVLAINGVSHVDRIEYTAIGKDEFQIRERCLYRDPVGANVSWRFSPIHKLGKPKKDVRKQLLGESEEWETDKDSIFYKLHKNVLSDYERSGHFSEGSVDKIMGGLADHIDKLEELLSDRKRPYLLIFGLRDGDRFIYPGELPAFTKYFRNKLQPESPLNVKSRSSDNKRAKTYCALCETWSDKVITLDKVFKFATFDKSNFLPGTKDGAGVKEKVFPVCEQCYATLSAGREEMENRFLNYDPMLGINLYVVPEIVFNKLEYYRQATDFTKEFLTKGIKHEEFLFKYLAGHEESLVYHFLFAEINQAQLIVHSLVEDVPPSRLKNLEKLWRETCTVFGYEVVSENKNKASLDTCFRQITAVMLSLAGKRDQDREVMRERVIATLSALLNGEQVRADDIKALIVSRLSGLFNDPDWINPKDKEKLPGRLQMKGMAEVVDFLIRANRREK